MPAISTFLELKPYLGRLLDPYDETQPGVDRFVVLGYSYWKRRFGGSAGAIGAKVTLNTTPMTIIGVASPEFDGLRAGYLHADHHVAVDVRR